MMYLSGCITPALITAQSAYLGVMYQPGMGNQLPPGLPWAADNGCYAQGERFDVQLFLHWLDGLTRDGCLFAVAPDVVGDMVATLARSLPMLPRIRGLGFKAALVGQDGAELVSIPWGEFDTWFIGGSTTWKLSPKSRDLALEAKRRGKWVHMGRVNSYQRVQIAYSWRCDSVDGTYLKFGPRTNWPTLLSWLEINYQGVLWS